jgi:hypothetical protein
MTGFDILILGFVAGIFVKDVGPKITGYFNAKKGGPMELPVAPYISNWIRLISHGVFTVVFLLLIIQFDAADLYTITLIIALTVMGLVPQPHGVHTKGLRAKGHFYPWKEIEVIAVPRNTSLFRVKLKRRLRSDVNFSVSIDERERLIKALRTKPVKLEIEP